MPREAMAVPQVFHRHAGVIGQAQLPQRNFNLGILAYLRVRLIATSTMLRLRDR